MKERKITGKIALEDLKGLFAPNMTFDNQTELMVYGFGQIVSTSQKLERVVDGETEKYFCFTRKGKEGEFIQRGENYLVVYKAGVTK